MSRFRHRYWRTLPISTHGRLRLESLKVEFSRGLSDGGGIFAGEIFGFAEGFGDAL